LPAGDTSLNIFRGNEAMMPADIRHDLASFEACVRLAAEWAAR
jgi:hypothetical protein